MLIFVMILCAAFVFFRPFQLIQSGLKRAVGHIMKTNHFFCYDFYCGFLFFIIIIFYCGFFCIHVDRFFCCCFVVVVVVFSRVAFI